ncbi:MAG TPA: hypothetical protein VMO26_10570 [Vicinamibacterales bacterium]|nr:hypothetical protein [Vicinamibacterales bacterium]
MPTVFLDAGGVLVFPNWERISNALDARGVIVAPDALAAAEPYAKRQLDDTGTVHATNDRERGWLYFNLILERAGVTLSRRHSPGAARCRRRLPGLRLRPRTIAHRVRATRHRRRRLTDFSSRACWRWDSLAGLGPVRRS